MGETPETVFPRGLEKYLKCGANPLRNAGAAGQILKSGIAPQRIESGIHPDPRYSSRVLQEGLLERIEGLLFFAKLRIRSRHEEPADVAFLGHFQSLA